MGEKAILEYFDQKDLHMLWKTECTKLLGRLQVQFKSTRITDTELFRKIDHKDLFFYLTTFNWISEIYASLILIRN